MPQANSRSITTSPQKSQLKRTAVAIATSFRRLIGLSIFEDPIKQTILVPVRNDGWAPDMCCGEFAVVDTTNIEPEDGAFIYRRGNGGHQAIVKLSVWDEKRASSIVEEHGRSGPYWSFVYGRQRVGNWTPAEDWWAPDGFVHMADGPLCDKFLREEIVGRIVGVLGAGDRAFSWKGAI